MSHLYTRVCPRDVEEGGGATAKTSDLELFTLETNKICLTEGQIRCMKSCSKMFGQEVGHLDRQLDKQLERKETHLEAPSGPTTWTRPVSRPLVLNIRTDR